MNRHRSACLRVALCFASFTVYGLRPCAAANTPVISLPSSIASAADLHKVAAALNQPTTQQQAFSLLLRFFNSPQPLSVTDDQWNALYRQAPEIDALPNLTTLVDTDIARLDDPQTCLQAIDDLQMFAAGATHQVGGVIFGGYHNQAANDLGQKAALALSAHDDPQTVIAALQAPDSRIRYWGAWMFHNAGDLSAWTPLLPQLEQVAATDPDESVRFMADERLEIYPQATDFLKQRVDQETSPDIIMQLLVAYWPTHEGDDHPRLYQRLLSLLMSADPQARHDTLVLIGSNSNPAQAPMFRFTFNKPIFDRVIALSQSKAATERADAAFALTAIRGIDDAQSRAAFMRLAHDPAVDVRWRVPGGLAGQLNREDVRRVIGALLTDRSPTVRYFAILADGPAKHVQDLQRLAQCPDKEIAAWASDALQQIASGKAK